MDIKTLIVGELQENCYIVTKNDKTIIIDPGDEAEKIINACKNLDVVEILITHHHFDHIGALKEIEKYFNLKENQKSCYFDYEVINTPGHTSDSISFYFKEDNVLFSGDFLFNGAIGRTDLPTGNMREMISSLKLMRVLPENTLVYPGHGESTMLNKEVANFVNYL